MALYPDCVDLARLGEREHWFTKSSAEANAELGNEITMARWGINSFGIKADERKRHNKNSGHKPK